MRLFSLLLVTPMLAAAGCGSASKDKDSPQPSPQPTPVTVDKAQTPDVLSNITSKPTPPLKLAAPRSPEKMLNGDDLSEMETDTLVEMGVELAQNREYADAAQALHWACLKGHHSQYDLACYLARAGKADAAFYFLQKAALGEGVDAEWAKEDKDLTSLRSDPRWRELFPFLRSACAYWQSSGLVRTSVVLPKLDLCRFLGSSDGRFR